jgi:hypothetical protein
MTRIIVVLHIRVIVGAMTIKRKIRKIRQMRNNADTSILDDSEEKETPVKDGAAETQSKEATSDVRSLEE